MKMLFSPYISRGVALQLAAWGIMKVNIPQVLEAFVVKIHLSLCVFWGSPSELNLNMVTPQGF